MQYSIDTKGLQPSNTELEQIDARVGLVLSRFTNLIEKCVIEFTDLGTDNGQRHIQCVLKLSMSNAHPINISDSSDNLADAFFLTLNRSKRNIERQLKRAKSTRVSSALGSRLS